MQTQLTTHVSNVLAPASLARKVNLLAALAATPLQSVANLGHTYRISLRTLRTDLSWLERRELITSYVHNSYGAGNECLFALTPESLAYLTRVQQCGTFLPSVSDTAKSRLGQQKLHRQYSQQVLRTLLRLPYYLELQKLGDWLSTIWWKQFSWESDLTTPRYPEASSCLLPMPSWLWLRDTSLTFDYHGRQFTCTVDALAIATHAMSSTIQLSRHAISPSHRQIVEQLGQHPNKQQQNTSLLWIFLDDGISPPARLHSRLRQLLRYRQENGIAPDVFPAVVIKASTRQRAWQWAIAAQHCAQRLALEPLQGILLFSGEAAQVVPPAEAQEQTPTHRQISSWPLVQDGLPAHPDSRLLSVRDLKWQPLLAQSRDYTGYTYLTSKLFCPCTRDVAQTITGSVRNPSSGLLNVMDTTTNNPLVWSTMPLLPFPPVPISPPSRPLWQPARREEILRNFTARERDWASCSRAHQRQFLADLIVVLDRCHLMLLALVASHPLITIDDLVSLTDLSPASLLHHMVLLRQAKLLKQIVLQAPATGFPVNGWQILSAPETKPYQAIAYDTLQCLQVQPLGFELLSALYDLPVNHLGFVQRLSGHPTSHDPGIHRFLGLLAEQTRVHSSERTRSDECDTMSTAKVELIWWKNAPVISLTFPSEGELVTITPDAAGEVRVSYPYRRTQNQLRENSLGAEGSSRVQQFWLEWDAGSENVRDLWDKLAAYQRYAQHQVWSALERTLPVLLIVTPEEHQEQRILRIISELQTRSEVQQAASIPILHMPAPYQQVLCIPTDHNLRWWKQHNDHSHAQSGGNADVAAPTMSGLYGQQRSPRRFLVYITTAQRLGQRGPLGACWIAKALL